MSEQHDMVTVTIDGVELKAPRNAMLIEVADNAGIDIPRFCYHKHLTIAANCRMCMVEVEKAPKPLPACATPVSEGMQVHTRSKLALDAQKGTMEFLLINHPLDCPVCDHQQYDWLTGERGSHTAVLCGRNADPGLPLERPCRCRRC